MKVNNLTSVRTEGARGQGRKRCPGARSQKTQAWKNFKGKILNIPENSGDRSSKWMLSHVGITFLAALRTVFQALSRGNVEGNM